MHFLRAVFGVGERHRMFQEDVLRWKCFTPHPFWDGSRGYALRYKGQIAAFGCVAPCRFLTASGTVPSCNVIDWAASKAVPGAGIMLYRHIQSLSGTMINIGGTEDARNVLPKIGFEERWERHGYTLVLRPWQHFRNTEARDWKSPLRLARDYRELTRMASGADGLRARRVLDGFDSVPAEVLPDPVVTRQVVCARTPQLLRYFGSCPAVKMEVYLLEREHTPFGYFLLNGAGQQARIADLWMHSADVLEWARAYRAATAVARAAKFNAVTVAASAPLQTKALEQAGYRRTLTEPVFVRDPEGRLQGRGDVALSWLENDGAYWRAH